MLTSGYPIKTFHTGCLLDRLFSHIYAQAQGATSSYTQKLIETYDSIPSRRGHATPLHVNKIHFPVRLSPSLFSVTFHISNLLDASLSLILTS